jgi:hypothetical protein
LGKFLCAEIPRTAIGRLSKYDFGDEHLLEHVTHPDHGLRNAIGDPAGF